jgi:drug/metabolite transporter (DMT)-like permease
MSSMSSRDWTKFLILALIWGSSFMWIKIAVADVSPFVLVTFRVFFAVLGILAIILITRGKFPLQKRWIGVFAFLGFFNVTFPFLLISWSEQYITSGMASILNSTVTLFTFLFASFFILEERLTWLKALGIILGFAGVVVISMDDIGSGLGNMQVGVIVSLIASACYGAANVFGRINTKGLEPNAQAFGQLTAAFIFIIPATIIFDPTFILPNKPITWFALVLLGLLNTAVATWLYYSLLNSVGSTRTSLVAYFIPLVGVILGILFMGESLSWNLFIGALMIVGGVLWVNYGGRLIHKFR